MFRSMLLLTLLSLLSLSVTAIAAPPNLLVITVDDMSADSLGAFGCALADTSPHIDRLASQGMRFEHAHVQVGNCMPSRNVMWSGRYPHRNGVEGFNQVKNINYPVLVDLMKRAGYFTGIRGKVSHSTPYHPYGWDVVLDQDSDGKTLHPKHAKSYSLCTQRGIALAGEANQPFCLLINVSDPHKPFYAEGKQGETVDDANVPTRVFSPQEVPIPKFLVDDPVIRKELAHYYSSVRRADDCVGEVLAALEESGASAETLVVFLSDHGMPLPFAKTQLYHHSSRTPLIVRWSGKVPANSRDDRHMVSAVDLLPTLLELLELPAAEGMDGRSFAPLLAGQPQPGRDYVFKQHNENAGGHRNPMRAVQSRDYLYLFNPWSDGQRVMATATAGTPTYRRLKQLAKEDPAIGARMQLFDHRVLEELYDMRTDPDALHNLVDQPEHRAALREMREQLATWMQQTDDPLAEVFERREDRSFRAAAMQRWIDEEPVGERVRPRRRGQPPGQPGGRRAVSPNS